MWRLAESLVKLREQLNAMHPKRDKRSDGAIGDARHAASKSDHNPNDLGVVCAIDVTHDPDTLSGAWLAEQLRESKDARIKYVIFAGRIFSSSVQPWIWRPYSGKNRHDRHVHISVNQRNADDARPWSLA